MNIERILESFRNKRKKERMRLLQQYIRSSPEDQEVITTSNKNLLRVGRNPNNPKHSNLDDIGHKVYVRQALRGQRLIDPNAKPDTSREGLKRGYKRFIDREFAMNLINNPVDDFMAKLSKLSKKD